MSHKQFEKLIFSEDELDNEKKQALQSHLLDCDACYDLDASFRHAEHLLKNTPTIAPRYGFSQRFQYRLKADQKRREGLQSLNQAGKMAGTSFFLIILWGLLLYRVPVEIMSIVRWIQPVADQVAWARTAGTVAGEALSAIPIVILLATWTILLGAMVLGAAGGLKICRQFARW